MVTLGLWFFCDAGIVQSLDYMLSTEKSDALATVTDGVQDLVCVFAQQGRTLHFCVNMLRKSHRELRKLERHAFVRVRSDLFGQVHCLYLRQLEQLFNRIDLAEWNTILC